jgi:hypothetical protein
VLDLTTPNREDNATNLKQLKLNFPKESGKVAITDMELQNLGREKVGPTLAEK